MSSTAPLANLSASEAAAPAASLLRAFHNWASAPTGGRRLKRAEALAVYEDMWHVFVRWCASQDPPLTRLETLTTDDARRFLASREASAPEGQLSAGYQWRLLRLIDRVSQHQAAVEARVLRSSAASEVIAAEPAIRMANVMESGVPTHLTPRQTARLMQFLGRTASAVGSAGTPAASWKAVRDVAAVALHLGAGLAPGDVRELKLDAPRWAGMGVRGLVLEVPGNGTRSARETPVAPWAGRVLKRWLDARRAAGLPEAADRNGDGPWLFPATRSGTSWGKVSHYQAVARVAAAAGLPTVGGGTFPLRHTFALRQLERGTSAETIAAWMGIVNASELERYLGAVRRPADVV